MLIIKHIKETDKYYAHDNIYYNGDYIGYIIKNSNLHFVFVNESNYIELTDNSLGYYSSFVEEKKKELLLKIKNIMDNKFNTQQ